MKNLLIVESPTKIKSIEKFLGKDYKVLASVGHVRDLMPSSRKGIDVEDNYAPVWKITKEKKIVMDEIKKATKIVKSNYILNLETSTQLSSFFGNELLWGRKSSINN